MYAAASKKKNITAKLATKSSPCAFCGREVDDEAKYGRLYEIGDISCHYFCALLSCCLIQKGKDEDGLFGFLYNDILAEIARCKKHKCSFCGCDGANLGCTVSQCKKQFHLPCGRERSAVSMFYGNYKSFCGKHAPKQKISDTVMEKVKERMAKKRLKNLKKAPSGTAKDCGGSDYDDAAELSCVICYEAVEGCPRVDTFWPPCCGRDAWFHRSCLERMCLSAGVHYLKCPLCNDKEKFREAVLRQGYYIPDRDAAWELEQNAFSEIYSTSYSCGLDSCLCPSGRGHDAESGPWDVTLCVLCGSAGAHARCRAAVEAAAEQEAKPYVCPTCVPSAESAPNLIQALHELARREAAAGAGPATGAGREVRPLMPSRMSLRRTKCRPPTSSSNTTNIESQKDASNTETSRLELNLKTPTRGRPEPEVEAARVEGGLLSPMKRLGLYERVAALDPRLRTGEALRRIRETLRVPQPLAVKRKTVIAILEDLMNTSYKDKLKMKEPLREWISPKKLVDIKQVEDDMQVIYPTQEDLKTEIRNTSEDLDLHTPINESILESPKLKKVEMETDSSMEISEDKDTVNIDVVTREESQTTTSPLKISFLKLSPNKNKCNKLNVDIDIESFQMQYLNETSQTNSLKRKLSDSDSKIELERNKKDDKRRRHNKERKKRCENEKKTVKIKVQFEKHNCDVDEGITTMNDKKLQKERVKSNTKKNKERIKIKLKFQKHNFEVMNKGKRLKEGKRIKKYKGEANAEKENVKIKLKINNKSFAMDNKSATSRKVKKPKKVKFNLHKDNRKEGENETTERQRDDRREKLKESPKVLKQYLLNYSEDHNKTTIVKPPAEVTLKRKRSVKKEKGLDNFKQTSLDIFFTSNLSPKDGKH